MRTLAAFALALALCAQPPSSPNLTGTYTNVSTERGTVTLRIEHGSATLRLWLIVRDDSMRMEYSTGGQESSNTMRGMPITSRVRWEGETLVVDSILRSGNSQWNMVERMTLGAGGKTLTVVQSSKGPGADGQLNTILFDRVPPEKIEKLTDEVYRNIQEMKGLPASAVTRAMDAYNRALGVACTHCHVADKWDDESVAAKQATRKMMRMQRYIRDRAGVSCWTCHRGELKVPLSPPERPGSQWPAGTVTLTAEQEKQPANAVFKNLRLMREIPAGRLSFVMNFFSASLGVDCSHCHVPGEWDKDDKRPKEAARRMYSMVRGIGQEFYGGNSPIGCYTCHRGSTRPEQAPAR